MKRFALTCAAVICSLVVATAAFAQATKAKSASKTATAKKDAVPAAAPTPPSPELIRARMRPPEKGTAFIEVIKGQSKAVGKEIHNTHKVKNIEDKPIVGLRIDEYFYAGQKEVAIGSGKLRTALAPGEIAEITTVAELKPGINASQLQFSHAGSPNGQVKPKAVKKFSEDKK
jgi:hypothetical protein